jgi:hypothetical protein
MLALKGKSKSPLALYRRFSTAEWLVKGGKSGMLFRSPLTASR